MGVVRIGKGRQFEPRQKVRHEPIGKLRAEAVSHGKELRSGNLRTSTKHAFDSLHLNGA